MRSVRTVLLSIFLLLSIAINPINSIAVTECTGKVVKIWTGDNGVLWIFFDNGVNGYFPPTDSDTKNVLAVSSIALVTGKTVTIRFQADSLPCNSSTNSRNDIIGVYLNN
uniref:hypothetical protein n=1 Tax=Candidatus Electronema sp. TaxID=2698783 RepID=UPI0040566948